MNRADLQPSHTYQSLPLIPIDEFLAAHPEHADADENALMTARINQEREERVELEKQRVELQKRKQKLIAENKKRRDDLANLDKDLEKFIDVRNPLCRVPGTCWTNRSNRPQNRFSSFLRRWRKDVETAPKGGCLPTAGEA